MMTDRLIVLSLVTAGAAALAACTPAPETATPRNSVPAAEIAGEPENCVQTTSISNTVVHDNQTIDFVMRGGKVYRNTLPVACSPLGFEKRFSYRTVNSQLCSTDTITVMQSGGVGGPTCGLGKFVPVNLTQNQVR
jgi:hypothetical protein